MLILNIFYKKDLWNNVLKKTVAKTKLYLRKKLQNVSDSKMTDEMARESILTLNEKILENRSERKHIGRLLKHKLEPFFNKIMYIFKK